MTIGELRDHLAKYTGEGKDDTPVVVAGKDWNPITESDEIAEILFIERKDGTSTVVIQTG